MKLINDIKISQELQEYWGALLGEELLEKVLRYPKMVVESGEYEEEVETKKLHAAVQALIAPMEYGVNMPMEKKLLFAPFFQCIAAYIKAELDAKITDGLRESVRCHLAWQTVDTLSWQCMRCLIGEMHRQKENGLLEGENPTVEYEYFCDTFLKDVSYVQRFFETYPVLTELIVSKTDFTVAYIGEIVEHLQKDRQRIVEQLCAGQEFGEVDGMQIQLSDEHVPGKTVAKIQLDHGCVIYHKPHELSMALYFNSVQEWLLEQCEMDSYPYRILSGNGYGWELEVESCGCDSEEEVQEYYRRMGILVCLTYILGITDLHFENMISHGKYPVIIDMEFIGDRRLPGRVCADGIKDLLSDTVANTGILPTALGNCLNLNVGGLGEKKEQVAPYKLPVLVNMGTSDMAVSYRAPKVNAAQSMPEWMGEKVDYKDYIPYILDGFTMAYRVVRQKKEEFIQKFAYGFEQKSRYLMRGTQEYFMYRNSANFPELMRDREARQLFLVHMDKGLFCNQKYRNEILHYEMKSVYHNVIPVFYSCGKDLYMGNGYCIKNYFGCTGEEQILSRIQKLSDKDCDLQRKVMEDVFLSEVKQSGRGRNWLDSDLYVKASLTPENIADLLLEDMYTANNEYGWIGISYNSAGRTYSRFVDLYLYHGLGGVALFFAALCQRHADDRYMAIYERIIGDLFEHTDMVFAGETESGECPWGLFTGEASLIYTYLILFEITGREECLKYAAKQGEFILKHLDEVTGFDLLSGKAGVIIAFLRLYEKTHRDDWKDAAEYLAEKLKTEEVQMENGIGWAENGEVPLAGMAHGNCGIVAAFACLFQYTSKKSYLDIIRAAIRYEDTLYDPERRNWMDIRDSGKHREGRDTIAWCHGSAGIVSGRLMIHRMTGLKLEELFQVEVHGEEEAKTALKRITDIIRKTEKTDLCLCHGNLGLSSILKQYQMNVERGMNGTFYGRTSGLSIEDRNNPGFMMGLSGIGYALLREERGDLTDVLWF